METCYGSSDPRTATTLLMFPLGRVILVSVMPKGSGLVQGRGVNNNMEEWGWVGGCKKRADRGGAGRTERKAACCKQYLQIDNP